MALSQTAKIALSVAFFGTLAFVLGVIAENKKPAAGVPIQDKGVLICNFPNDPTVALGTASALTLAICAILGVLSVFYPYKGKTVPKEALFSSTSLLVFFVIAAGVTTFAEVMTLWATITEGLHHARNVHHDLAAECATAKTGLFGGAAFLSLDAMLFWLICQMLTLNARADYLEDEDPKGEYGQVMTTDYDANGGARGNV